MDFYSSCYQFVYSLNTYLAVPSIIIFLGTGIILTIKLGFPQIRGFSRLIKLIKNGIKESKNREKKTIGPFQALFTSMSATVGIGNIVGPSMAVAIGGPGALFWLIIYIFFGSVTKFTEVTFSVHSRTTSEKGDIIGGPTQYLRLISPLLGIWYAALTTFLFTIWSSIQVNTISCIYIQEGISPWITAVVVVAILLLVVLGGVKRIGSVASKLVPLKFIVYIVGALFILIKNFHMLGQSIKLILQCAFAPSSACGAVMGITVFSAIWQGIYKAIFITESGTGTSSFAHSLSDAQYPTDQALLAMYSGIAEITLCCISGLVTLVTGVWQTNKLSNTLIYEAFKINIPLFGNILLLIVMFLFALTALIGNTFNGSQSFASLTRYKYINLYYIFAALVAFSGALIAMPFLWNFMDIILALVAIPNLIGLLILVFKYPFILKIRD